MPDLGKYTSEVLSAYAVTLLLLLGIVAMTWWRSVRVRRQLKAIEGERGYDA